ncbi:hypothetical protein B0H19DRAFT_1115833 [Mycena capillaripes]|nr:hypothetical protein B0H19DRAFT_1115833 [Mycena capillaripes]
MQHNPTSSKRRMPLAISSFRRALDVSRFETPQHRRKRLGASRINTLAPISSLPPEVLCQIFLFCVPSIPEVGNSGLGWLTVTHVTHLWREVALGCPELWANIIFRRKLVAIGFSRAKTLPLVIRIHLENNNKHFDPSLIRENIARVGVLDVRGSQNALDTFFLDSIGKVSAPRLRSLSVVNTFLDDPLWLDPGVFLGGEGINLLPRQLRLERCALPWNSPWYFNLTDLYLAHLHHAHAPTITMLLSVIIASPLLQHLTLIDTKTHGDYLDTVFPFTLPDLRTIHLSEPLSVCAQILMNLTFPSIVTTIVSCLSAPNYEDGLAHALIGHPDFLERYHFLRIDAPPNTPIHISANSSSSDKTVFFEIHHHSIALYSLVQHTADSLPFLTSLHLNMPSLGVDSWRSLCKCHNLTALTLQNNYSRPILTLLLERAIRSVGVSVRPVGTEDIGPDGTCAQLLPKLECIALEEVDCGDSQPYPAITDVLRSLLWARRVSRCPIPRVRLERCKNVFKQDLDHFAFLTDLFIWDGVGQNTKDKDDGGYVDIRSFSLSVVEHLQGELPYSKFVP